MTRPTVLVSNLMMLKERDRFDATLRDLGAEPIWPQVDQFLDEAACLDWAGKVDVWAAGDDRISRAVLQGHLPRLIGIAKWGTGLDSIDLQAAGDLGIPVYNTPGAFEDAVAEVALGYMLILTRGLLDVDREVRAGNWPKPKGLGLSGRILGQVGLGAIGSGIACRARACGMEVIAHDPFLPADLAGETPLLPLNTLLKEADVLCLACNLTPENTGLIDAGALARMKPQAIVVNVGRGPLIREVDLITALQVGRIAGAGLDVFEVEPLPMTSPLRTLPNVVLGSHNANNQHGAVERVHANTLDKISTLLRRR